LILFWERFSLDIALRARGETDFSETPNVSRTLYLVVTTPISEALYHLIIFELRR